MTTTKTLNAPRIIACSTTNPTTTSTPAFGADTGEPLADLGQEVSGGHRSRARSAG